MSLLALTLLALQRDDTGAAIGIGLLIVLIILLIALGLYAYVAICFQRMANKIGVSDSWWAWVPILNLFLLVKMAAKPLWWGLLFFIPLANLVVAILCLVAVLEALKKPPLFVIGFFIPVLNLVLLGYLAFAD